MRAVDSTVYREELQGAAGHTVTFARAPDLNALGPGSREEATQVGGLGDDAKTVLGLDAYGDMPTPTALTGLPLGRRGRLVPVGVAGLLLLLLGSGGVYYFRHARLAPRPLTEAERSQLVQPDPGLQAPPPAPVPPVVEALPPRTEAPGETTGPTEDKAPRRRPMRARAEVEAEVAEKRRIEVDRKFKEVRAEYVGFKAEEKRAKWMPPRGEGNKVGYYRILHTKLQYKNADGKNRELDITSLISWRGEWFVVHVDGFK